MFLSENWDHHTNKNLIIFASLYKRSRINYFSGTRVFRAYQSLRTEENDQTSHLSFPFNSKSFPFSWKSSWSRIAQLDVMSEYNDWIHIVGVKWLKRVKWNCLMKYYFLSFWNLLSKNIQNVRFISQFMSSTLGLSHHQLHSTLLNLEQRPSPPLG